MISPQQEKMMEVSAYQAEILYIEEVKLPELQRDLARLQSSDGWDQVQTLKMPSLIVSMDTSKVPPPS